MERISVKRMFLMVCIGAMVSMLTICAVSFAMTGNLVMLACGVLLTVCALIWLFVLMELFGKRLSVFTKNLCRAMDQETVTARCREFAAQYGLPLACS